MGNQQPAMSEQAITKYYKDLINQNKENISYKTLSQTESRNRLKPTSKANLDLKIQTRSSEKTLKTLQNTTTVVLYILTRKHSPMSPMLAIHLENYRSKSKVPKRN